MEDNSSGEYPYNKKQETIARDYYIDGTRVMICTDECVPDDQIGGIIEKIGVILSKSKRKKPSAD